MPMEEDIAMKVFKNMHMDVFKREVEIYDTYMLYHENILRFIGHDQKEFREFCLLFLFNQMI